MRSGGGRLQGVGYGLPPAHWVECAVEGSGLLSYGDGLVAAARQGGYALDVLFTSLAVAAQLCRCRVFASPSPPDSSR